MRPPLRCSPRHQNVLDIVDYLVNRGYVERTLADRFRATAELEPQRGALDLGTGLCGQRGRRLARDLQSVGCPDCRALLRALENYDATG